MPKWGTKKADSKASKGEVQKEDSLLTFAGGGGSPLAAEAADNGLDEAELDRISREAADAFAQYGAQDERAQDAKARCESEVARWQLGAQRAAEVNNFEEYECLASVAYRVSSLLQSLKEPKAQPVAPALARASPSALEGDALASKASSKDIAKDTRGKQGRSKDKSMEDISKDEPLPLGPREHSKTRKSRRPKEDAPPVDGSGDASFAAAFGSAFASGLDCEGASAPSFEAGSFGASFGAAPWVGAAAGPPSGPWLPETYGVEDSVSMPTSPPGQIQGAAEPFDCSVDVGRCAQLEAQVEILQANNMELHAQLSEAHEQMRRAWQRVQLLESAQSDVAVNDSAFLDGLREAHKQLEREHDQTTREVQQLKTRLSAAEAKVAERDALLTQTRQRLFDEKNRCSQLEDDIQGRDAMRSTLQGKLQGERTKFAALEREQRLLQHACGLGTVQRGTSDLRVLSAPRAFGNQKYGRGSPADESAEEMSRAVRTGAPKVLDNDELAVSIAPDGRAQISAEAPAEAPLQRLARNRPENDDGASGGRSMAASRAPAFAILPRSDIEIWARTARVDGPPAVLVSRSPPATPDLLGRVCGNFRNLLAKPKGPLYEDEHVVVEMALASVGTAGASEQHRAFEARVVNRGSQPLGQVRLRGAELGRPMSFDLRLEPLHTGAASTVWPQGALGFQGRLDVLSPYEAGPQAELHYLLPDNSPCTAIFRLPLTVAQFMAPVRISAPRFLELWLSPEFVQAEVAFICTVRSAFLQAGGNFLFAKSLELGGTLSPLEGLEASPEGLVLAGSLPPLRPASEVLVRAELGGLGGRGERGLCRVAIRSVSYMVSRGLARVIIDILSDPS